MIGTVILSGVAELDDVDLGTPETEEDSLDSELEGGATAGNFLTAMVAFAVVSGNFTCLAAYSALRAVLFYFCLSGFVAAAVAADLLELLDSSLPSACNESPVIRRNGGLTELVSARG